VSGILIDISASDEWDKDEISLVEKILLFSFKALSNKKLTEISVRLTGDEEIKLLNKQYRDKNSSTNVLSFPLLNDAIHPEASEMLGDIVISKDTVLREAKNLKKSFEQHLSHLGIHGLLHLMGFSHDKENEALIMEGIEVKILKDLGIPNPYEGVI
jgi:probable rRNA maturation factor